MTKRVPLYLQPQKQQREQAERDALKSLQERLENNQIELTALQVIAMFEAYKYYLEEKQ